MSSSGADGLNRAQRTAVTTSSGPLLVLAGAGTGKTRVITFRIAELIRCGVTPSRILAVTFTNKAAKEMRQRALTLLGARRKKRKAKGPEISTFHSLCVRILRRNAKLLGYPDNFTIYDRGDQESLARAALRDIRVGAQSLRPGDLINLISGWKGSSIGPEQAQDVAQDDREVLAAQAYEKYQKSLRTSGAMDFDDLLNLTEKLFIAFPEARFAEASRFDHLLIDEYQDTNGLQYRIVKALAERHRNICVVGDDDQSIYGWRGAEVEHILGFKDQWKEAKVVRLEENYRSTGWILHLANTLIAHNKVRHEKLLRPARSNGEPPRFVPYEDENHEAEAVVGEIFRKINREGEERIFASDIAILFRTNEQPRAFEQEMRKAGVPYRLIGGQSFYDRKEIKDLLAYLRVVANPSDEVSLLRIINAPPRGIGTGTVQTLLSDAVESGKPLWDVLPQAIHHPDLSQSASLAVEDFRQTLDEFRARVGDEPLAQLVVELIERVDYKTEIQRQYKDPSEQETRWNAVQELVNAVTSYQEREEEPSLLGFIEESTLSDRDDGEDDNDKQQHAVTLMTLHSAKGLEFPEVYLVGMEEGLLPHKRSLLEDANTIPEERRLAYVGVTRAQTKLTLSFCKGRMKWGKQRAQIPSRFLMEMRGETEKARALAAQAEEQFSRDRESVRLIDEKKNQKKKPKREKSAGRETNNSKMVPDNPNSQMLAGPVFGPAASLSSPCSATAFESTSPRPSTSTPGAVPVHPRKTRSALRAPVATTPRTVSETTVETVRIPSILATEAKKGDTANSPTSLASSETAVRDPTSLEKPIGSTQTVSGEAHGSSETYTQVNLFED